MATMNEITILLLITGIPASKDKTIKEEMV